MPLIKNIEDPSFVKQLDLLDHRNQFVREIASVILTSGDGFESVLSLANRVYDRHCSPRPGLVNPRRFCRPARTALSA